ncbi:phage portal protein [Desulfatitalea tepidiphila]|uniref:phage portal protein n=1 Tax=Desulfatitalea tepidiphila TaxID=1185843 RepID=UPI0006B5FFFC|nr:phage portal protein [Desulfatitalea tepidiphila]
MTVIRDIWRAFVAHKAAKQRAWREFEAAGTGRLFGDWVTESLGPDSDVRGSLRVLRARSRHLCQNNDYGKRFLHLLDTNVIGPKGIELRAEVKERQGDKLVIDAAANEKIERAWQAWCKKNNCTVDKKMSFRDVQGLFIKTVARDGENITRKIRGFDNNDFKFALQMIEADQLDDQLNDEARRIRMGVQKNEWNEPVGYHILQNHPQEMFYSPNFPQRHAVLPAGQVLHNFIVDRVNQTRGVPWTHAAMQRLHMVGKYEQSELVASRIGAAKMGFFTYQNPGGYYPGADEEDGAGNFIEDVEPGKFKALPYGWDFKQFSADHPNAGFDAFVKAVLRGAASGLNLSYITLANDMGEANYSSMRHGVLEDRDAWKVLQGWMIEHFVAPVYEAWLDMALVSRQLDLPARKIEKWQQVAWQGRRWAWIDPAKEITASERAIKLRLKSRTRVAAESGDDIEEVLTEIANENTLASGLGVELEQAQKGAVQNGNTAGQ